MRHYRLENPVRLTAKTKRLRVSLLNRWQSDVCVDLRWAIAAGAMASVIAAALFLAAMQVL